MADKPCLRTSDGSVRVSYGELDHRASTFAAQLRARACRPGDRVILGLSNTPNFFVALFACFRGGLIAVPLDANLATEELRVLVDHAEPSAIVVDDKTKAKLAQIGARCEPFTVEEGNPSISDGLPADSHDRGPVASAEGVSEADPALLIYTSGTTGDPKGVLFSHAQLIHKIEAIRTWFGFDESYTSLCLLPTHFGHGLICNCMSTFGYGGCLVIAPPFNLDLLSRLWSILERNSVNTVSSVPTVVRLLMDHAKRRAAVLPSSLKFVTCASAPLRVDEISEFEERFGVPLLNCYGLTETAGWSACSPSRQDRNLASVGKALDCEIRVVGPDGTPLKPGERGELQIKGPSVPSGYDKAKGAFSHVTPGGWLATGDVGELDESGAVILHTRIKEIIIRAGKNIYPAEVDGVLMSHPDVAEACTVGLSDVLLGEKVAACVVPREDSSPTEAGLIAHVQKRLAAYKCPQRIIFVDRIPKTSRGKVNRSKLRSLFGE